MGHALSHPILSKNAERFGSTEYKVGSTEMQGWRVDMEDTITVKLKLSDDHPNTSFFGVYDGHGGNAASIFCKARIHEHIAQCDSFDDDENLIKAVEGADAEFLEQTPPQDKQHGSTCVFCLVTPDEDSKDNSKYNIICANVGDSRAILIKKDGTFEELTHDHKPEDEMEQARIAAAGGHVQHNRVDGQLAMSRAIGDFGYKNDASLSVSEQKVIPSPDITRTCAEKGDILLICCDGIVEQMEAPEVASFTHKEYSENPDPVQVCAKLLNHSVEKGSKDNHSALIVHFADGTDYEAKNKQTEYLPGPYEPYASSGDFTKAYKDDCIKHGLNPDDPAEWEEIMKKAKTAESDAPSFADDMPMMPIMLPGAGAGGEEEEDALTSQARLMAVVNFLRGRAAAGQGDPPLNI